MSIFKYNTKYNIRCSHLCPRLVLCCWYLFVDVEFSDINLSVSCVNKTSVLAVAADPEKAVSVEGTMNEFFTAPQVVHSVVPLFL